MRDDFLEDHMAGRHQDEIVALMNKIEPCLHGHSRALILITLLRLQAAMLGPANKKARDEYLKAMPVTVRNILKRMDELKALADA